MLKALFKKQMIELTNGFILDRKTGKRRVGGALVGMIVLYAFVFVTMFAMFFMLGISLCAPLCESGMAWLYFAITSLVALMLGLFGSVFTTYSSLYNAKDNDLLLSMPIAPGKIVLVRLAGVYTMGLIYSSLVMLPTIVVYYIFSARSVTEFIFPFLLMLFISVIVLTLACLLGWVVAQISARIRNKSFITVVLSLGFIAAYYYIYFRANAILSSILANSGAIAAKIRGSAYPLYILGRAGAGEIVPMLLFAAAVIALFALTYLLLSRTFFSTATANRGTAKKRVSDKTLRRRSVGAALFSRELDRFVASPTYMLNCGLGLILLVIGGVIMAIKGKAVTATIYGVFGNIEGYIPVLLLAAICLVASMSCISAPSVSLEGKTLWLMKSLPVPAWQALHAKLLLHIVLTSVPVLLCCVCALIGLGVSALPGIIMTAAALMFVLASAALGLAVNLKTPNLEWKDETVPIKQSMGVLVSMFGGWLIAAALGGIYFAVAKFIGAELYLLICTALLAVLAFPLLHWIKTRGTKIFESL